MAQPLTWQTRATNEFFEILAWVEKDSLPYANRISDRFEARAESLRHHPRQGRKLPRFEGIREIREVFVHRWRMIYEVNENGIVILAIVHGARLLENTEPL